MAGDLDDSQWSAARLSTLINQGQDQYDAWPASTSVACGKTTTGVLPNSDLFFCAGGGTPSMHLNDSYNDGGGFTIHSYRIRRPFDFANRTGVIAFDVGGKAQVPGGHGFWFNVFLSQEPVPAPYQQGGALALYAKAGLGIEFEASPAPCGSDGTHNGVSNFYLEQNYQIKSSFHPPDSKVTCFKTQEEVMNHIEIHVSATKVEVFASDAGNPQSIRSVVAIDSTLAPNIFPLPLTRAYVSFQQTHYNAAKFTWTDPKCTQNCCEWSQINDPSCVCDPTQPSETTCSSNSVPHCPQLCPTLPSYATYHWDNIGFDGPSLPTPRSYEVPTTLLTGANGVPDGVNTGYLLRTSGMSPTGTSNVTIPLQNVNLTGAVDAVLTLNAWLFHAPDTIGYRFNGGTWRTFNHPFPTSDDGARAVAIPVSLSDLQSGTNTLEMNSGSGSVVAANVELTVDTQ